MITETNIKDCCIITPVSNEDYRGEYVETWNKESYSKIKDIDWKQDDFSFSHQGVLRGLHGDWKTWKLVQSVHGRLFLAVVDLRRDSETYCEVFTTVLSIRNHNQVLVPPGCANGHQCLSDTCTFHYKQSEYYDAESQFTLDYKDEMLAIDWPIKNSILSERDKKGLRFLDISKENMRKL